MRNCNMILTVKQLKISIILWKDWQIRIFYRRIDTTKKNPLGKSCEKQTKTIADQGIKQVKTLKALIPEES